MSMTPLTGFEYRGWKVEPANVRSWSMNLNVSDGWVIVSRLNPLVHVDKRNDNKQILCVVSSEKIARDQIDYWHQVQTYTTNKMLGGNHDEGK